MSVFLWVFEPREWCPASHAHFDSDKFGWYYYINQYKIICYKFLKAIIEKKKCYVSFYEKNSCFF